MEAVVLKDGKIFALMPNIREAEAMASSMADKDEHSDWKARYPTEEMLKEHGYTEEEVREVMAKPKKKVAKKKAAKKKVVKKKVMKKKPAKPGWLKKLLKRYR